MLKKKALIITPKGSRPPIRPSGKFLYGAVSLFLLLLTDALLSPVWARGDDKASATGFWLWTFLGRLHPMIVHFPVGVLYVAFFFELFSWRKRTSQFRGTIKILTLIGAFSAVVAVILGLLLINSESYGSSILPIHQWSGIATMVLACGSAWLYHKNYRREPAILLALTLLGVTIAGHYGGELTHGEDYLSSVLPFGKNGAANATADDEGEPGNNFSLASFKGPLTTSQVQDLNLQVRTILAHNCYSCHGSAKVKGDLRLDSRAELMKGGKNGSILTPGHPDKSELIRRIQLPRNDKDAMPSKGKGLSPDEIATLSFWIKEGAPWPDGPEKSLFRVAALGPRLPEIPPATTDLINPIDRFVNAYFEKKKLNWSAPVDDRTYLRRVYLDITGLLPPPDTIDAFLKDSRPDKRSYLAQTLLNRNTDYAQHWLTFWNDALRNDYTGTGYITGGRKDITKWLYAALLNDLPYNTFVSQLISPEPASEGFIKGIEWRGVVNASQRTEMQAAQNVSQVFLGLNLKCASCHDSFVSDWKLDQSYAFANVFSDSSMEINRCDKPTGRMAGRRILYKELGEIDPNADRKLRLKQLADELVQPKDGRLYRTLVNRVWAQLMGRGIVEPVDVMDNAPWSQDLLDWMAYDFVASGCDIKKLIFTIVTSRIYSLPSIAIKDPASITAPGFVFKGMLRRRMTAEEFSDAVSGAFEPIYGDSMLVCDQLPENAEMRTGFPRASLVKNNPFLTALGRPNRETVSTSRISQANLLQALELTNGNLFNNAMKKASVKWRTKYPDPSVMVRQIYRNALGRAPDKEEESIAKTALGASPSVDATQDFLWAMALHPEFQLIY